jgi:hypothetical protein
LNYCLFTYKCKVVIPNKPLLFYKGSVLEG